MKRYKKISLLLFFTIIILILSYVGRLVKIHQDSLKANKVVLRFAISSHAAVVDEPDESLADFIQKTYMYSEQNDYQQVDAFIINGGLTRDGSANSYMIAEQQIEELVHKETRFFEVVGENDFSTIDDNIDSEILKRARDYVTNVNGFSFVFMTPNYNSYIDKLQWLDDNLSKLCKDNDKPVFLCMYGAIKDTYYGTKTWYSYESDDIKAIIGKYPNVIVFSSATQCPANIGKSIYVDNATYVNNATLSNLHMGFRDMDIMADTGAIYTRTSEVSQCRIVEVYGDGHCAIKTMDTKSGQLYEISGQNEMIWYPCMQMVRDDEGYENISGPVFTQSQILAEDTPYGVALYIPSAIDLDGVLCYQIEFQCVDGTTVVHNVYANEPLYEKECTDNYLIADLQLAQISTIRVIPYDYYGASGLPLIWNNP